MPTIGIAARRGLRLQRPSVAHSDAEGGLLGQPRASLRSIGTRGTDVAAASPERERERMRRRSSRQGQRQPSVKSRCSTPQSQSHSRPPPLRKRSSVSVAAARVPSPPTPQGATAALQPVQQQRGNPRPKRKPWAAPPVDPGHEPPRVRAVEGHEFVCGRAGLCMPRVLRPSEDPSPKVVVAQQQQQRRREAVAERFRRVAKHAVPWRRLRRVAQRVVTLAGGESKLLPEELVACTEDYVQMPRRMLVSQSDEIALTVVTSCKACSRFTPDEIRDALARLARNNLLSAPHKEYAASDHIALMTELKRFRAKRDAESGNVMERALQAAYASFSDHHGVVRTDILDDVAAHFSMSSPLGAGRGGFRSEGRSPVDYNFDMFASALTQKATPEEMFVGYGGVAGAPPGGLVALSDIKRRPELLCSPHAPLVLDLARYVCSSGSLDYRQFLAVIVEPLDTLAAQPELAEAVRGEIRVASVLNSYADEAFVAIPDLDALNAAYCLSVEDYIAGRYRDNSGKFVPDTDARSPRGLTNTQRALKMVALVRVTAQLLADGALLTPRRRQRIGGLTTPRGSARPAPPPHQGLLAEITQSVLGCADPRSGAAAFLYNTMRGTAADTDADSDNPTRSSSPHTSPRSAVADDIARWRKERTAYRSATSSAQSALRTGPRRAQFLRRNLKPLVMPKVAVDVDAEAAMGAPTRVKWLGSGFEPAFHRLGSSEGGAQGLRGGSRGAWVRRRAGATSPMRAPSPNGPRGGGRNNAARGRSRPASRNGRRQSAMAPTPPHPTTTAGRAPEPGKLASQASSATPPQSPRPPPHAATPPPSFRPHLAMSTRAVLGLQRVRRPHTAASARKTARGLFRECAELAHMVVDKRWAAAAAR